MADKILHKRSLTPGSVPTTSSLETGELAINVYDGKLFLRQSGSVEQIITVGESASFATTASFASNGISGLTTNFIPKATSATALGNSIIQDTGTNVRISGSLEVTGSITSTLLTGSDNRVVVANPSGTLQPTSQTIIDAYIDPNGVQAGQLNTTSNWDIYGEYIGTAITDTFQGQRHYNIDYFFEAVNDNEWIRLIRG
jgi:hypothetical protein